MSNHVMIDVETLGTHSDAAILSVAAVPFDPLAPEDHGHFYKVTDLEHKDTQDTLGTIDAQTIHWWMLRSHTFGALGKSADKSTFPVLLSDLFMYLATLRGQTQLGGKQEDMFVWANSPTFDLAVLRSAGKRVFHTSEVPWNYQQEMDVRTLRTLRFPDRSKEAWQGYAELDISVQHNALHDAVRQVAMVQQCYAELGLGATGDRVPLENVEETE